MRKRLSLVKYYSICLILVLAISLLTGCSKESTAMDLPIDQLLSDEGLYQWPDTKFGDSINDTEKSIGYEFPVIPYMSQEWHTGEKPTKDSLYDYRNQNDYEYVEYAVYDNKQPVLVKYKDYRGHLTCIFHQGGLRMVACYFGTSPSKRDEKMDYGRADNDPDQVFAALQGELTDTYGAPDNELQAGSLQWILQDTRLTLSKQGDADSMTVIITVQVLLQ